MWLISHVISFKYRQIICLHTMMTCEIMVVVHKGLTYCIVLAVSWCHNVADLQKRFQMFAFLHLPGNDCMATRLHSLIYMFTAIREPHQL